MSKIISLNNYKGGTSKTFTALNMAVGFANKGKRTLMIDLDPQGNTSMKLVEDFENVKGLNEVILNQADIKDVIYETKVKNLFVIPTNLSMQFGGVKELENKANREFLKMQLKKIKDDYDYIIFDNNPNIEIFLRNLTFCCDWIIIPVSIDMNAIKGVDGTIDVIKDVINSTDADLNVSYKILLTMVGRTKTGKEFEEAVRNRYNDIILDTTIRYQKKPAETQTLEDDYFAINDKAPISEDLQNLVNEIERRLG